MIPAIIPKINDIIGNPINIINVHLIILFIKVI